MTTLLIGLGLLAYLFRKPLLARLAVMVPDRASRHRFISTIIAAFLIVFGLRLIVRFVWG
ncbi:MAG: hypothetical protein ACRCWO_08850 [Bosea sp. (in: a-proteobacteria)]